MLSHETAAEVHGIIDTPLGTVIHVTVPLARRPAQHRPTRGIVIHRSGQSQTQFVGPIQAAAHESRGHRSRPGRGGAYLRPRLLVDRSCGLPEAGDSGRAPRRPLPAGDRIRWRQWLADALEDAGDGVYSSLERRYVRDVERAHGLPRSQHQARRLLDGKAQYRDNWYPGYRVVVEIDGPDYHQNERVQLDKDRDNRNLALDDVKTHRFGPVGVTEHACQTAAMVAVTLQRNGWRGLPHACRRPDCAVGSRGARPNRRTVDR